MPLSFPSSPTTGQTYTAGARTWTWSGSVWELNANTTGVAAVGTGNIADGAVTTEKIANGAVVEADIAANAVTAGKLGTDVQLGYRNVIINGGFDIWQRGTTNSTVGNTYLADRFLRATSTGGTQSRDTDVPSGEGFRYSWKHVASTTNSFMQMGQQVEFINCKHLQNKTITISFWAKAINSNTGSTALTVATRTNAGVDALTYFSGAYSPSSVTLTTSWNRYTITKTLPSTFGALSLEFILGSHVSGDGFLLTGVQLERGSVATPFEFEDFGTTLAKCQRYYIRHNAQSNYAAFGTGTFTSTINLTAIVAHPVTMRAAVSSVDALNLAGADGNNPVLPATIQLGNTSQYGTEIYTAVTGATQYRPGLLSANNTTNAYLALNAEL